MLVGAFAALLQASRFSPWERPLLILSFVAHVSSAFLQVWLTRSVYGGGDLFNYADLGETLAALLRVDFSRFAPEVLRILLHGTGALPFQVPGVGSSTGSMIALAGLLSYLTAGSTYTLCLLVALGAYFGGVALYRALSITFPAVLHRRLLFAATLVPSMVFWTSALLKEGVAMSGLGYVMLGLVRVRREGGVMPLVEILAGAFVVGLIKAYILFPLVLSGTVWFYFELGRSKGRALRLSHLIFGGLLAAGGVVVLGRLFPQYALDNLAEQAASNKKWARQ